jgi:hypothetical protein
MGEGSSRLEVLARGETWVGWTVKTVGVATTALISVAGVAEGEELASHPCKAGSKNKIKPVSILRPKTFDCINSVSLSFRSFQFTIQAVSSS